MREEYIGAPGGSEEETVTEKKPVDYNNVGLIPIQGRSKTVLKLDLGYNSEVDDLHGFDDVIQHIMKRFIDQVPMGRGSSNHIAIVKGHKNHLLITIDTTV